MAFVLYYKHKKPDKDRKLKCDIEKVLRDHPSYGSRRLSLHLKLNRKNFYKQNPPSNGSCPWGAVIISVGENPDTRFFRVWI